MKLTFATFLAVLLVAPSVHAEPCPAASAVEGGAVAPCSGTLVPDAWLASLLKDRAERKRLEEVLVARDAAHLAAQDACQKSQDLLRAALDSCQASAAKLFCPPTPWTSSPWFAGSLGAIVGAGVGVGLTWAVR
jgi:hypothetical protein